MVSKAQAKYLRMSASKTRLVVDLIRGKSVDESLYILNNLNKGACKPVEKVVNAAFANANFDKQEKYLSKELYVSVVKADGGPMLKRYRAATMGRATPIRHRTTHLYVELDLIKGKMKEKSK